MGPLKNIRHEKFAQEILTSPTNKDAYIKAYPDVSSPVVASNNASRLLDSVSVKQRILELMQEKSGTSPEGVTKRLNELVESENEGVAMNAVNTALKAYKVFEEDANTQQLTAIQIVFGTPEPPKDAA